MKKKILLCLGNINGKEIENFLKKKYSVETLSSKKEIKSNQYLSTKYKFNIYLKNINKTFDYIILFYWPFLVHKNNLKKFNNSINFHPSFLPQCKGWYPHVHAKIKNLVHGVTLHKIDSKIDNGEIWFQKKIKINFTDTSTDVYKKSMKQIIKLFKQNFKKIEDGFKPKTQKKNHSLKYKTFKKKDVNKYDKISINKKIQIKKFINLALAREFNGKSFLYFIHKKKKYNIKITINEI